MNEKKEEGKKKFEDEKVEIEEEVKEMWEEQGKKMVDDAKMDYANKEVEAEEFTEKVLDKLRTEHEGDEEWTERINEFE